MEWNGRVARIVEPPRADLVSDQEVLDYVRSAAGRGPAVVAIDCPLAVPNPSGLRDCDRLVNECFRKFQAGVYPANRHNLGRYDGLRGEDLTRALAADGFSVDPRTWAERKVIEVYPHAAMVALFRLRRTLKYKPREGRAYEVRWREMRKLQGHIRSLARARPALVPDGLDVRTRPEGLRGAALKGLEDRLDAIVCAYIGLLFGLEGPRRCAVFGDRERGHIVIPMTHPLFASLGSVSSRDVLFWDASRANP